VGLKRISDAPTLVEGFLGCMRVVSAGFATIIAQYSLNQEAAHGAPGTLPQANLGTSLSGAVQGERQA
jgi:hypothetical protein